LSSASACAPAPAFVGSVVSLGYCKFKRQTGPTFLGGVKEDHSIDTPEDNIVSSSLCSRSNHSMTSFSVGFP
jgi:hypothetical protein